MSVLGSDGLVVPRKVRNPCLESREVRNLNSQIKWNAKAGVNVLNKSELDRVLERQRRLRLEREKEEVRLEEERDNPFALVIKERAKRLQQLEDEKDKAEAGDERPAREAEDKVTVSQRSTLFESRTTTTTAAPSSVKPLRKFSEDTTTTNSSGSINRAELRQSRSQPLQAQHQPPPQPAQRQLPPINTGKVSLQMSSSWHQGISSAASGNTVSAAASTKPANPPPSFKISTTATSKISPLPPKSVLLINKSSSKPKGSSGNGSWQRNSGGQRSSWDGNSSGSSSKSSSKSSSPEPESEFLKVFSQLRANNSNSNNMKHSQH